MAEKGKMMKDYLSAAHLQFTVEGKRPTLSELIDRAEELRNRDVQKANTNAFGAIEDFISMAKDALEQADDCGEWGNIQHELVRLKKDAERVLNECQK